MLTDNYHLICMDTICSELQYIIHPPYSDIQSIINEVERLTVHYWAQFKLLDHGLIYVPQRQILKLIVDKLHYLQYQ